MTEKDVIHLDRRQFLRLAGGALVGAGTARLPGPGSPQPASTPPYIVGVGHDSDPYAATQQALAAPGAAWNPAQVAGKRVVIKPNLVQPELPETGVTTDPEVVRAVVDRALADGATSVVIVETGPDGANFSACGYDDFNTYDPRVSLLDLAAEETTLVPFAGGTAYGAIFMPSLLLAPDTFLISAGKLKVHNHTQATLAVKNLFGLPPADAYTSPPRIGRFAMHDRSVNQAAIDINLARPADFALVDGIWGLEGIGPYGGTPVQTDLVLAGHNALAVDYVCLAAMSIPAARVLHLRLASAVGLGPTGPGQISVVGDTFSPVAFAMPDFLPVSLPARATPYAFQPSIGGTTTITATLVRQALVRVEVVRASATDPTLPPVRTLLDWTVRQTGPITTVWDGRDDAGSLVAPGSYGLRVAARNPITYAALYSFGWTRVLGP